MDALDPPWTVHDAGVLPFAATAIYIHCQIIASPEAAAAEPSFKPHAFLEIAADDTVTVWVGQTNLGQGTHTGIPMIVAEELDAAWETVQVMRPPQDVEDLRKSARADKIEPILEQLLTNTIDHYLFYVCVQTSLLFQLKEHRYGPEYPNRGPKDLDTIIEDADRRMVAHPTFLDELRALVQRYRDQVRQVFFSDDFSDGDYTHSPEWSVVSGNFTVTRDNRLRSEVAQQYRTRQEPRTKRTDPGEEAAERILKEILGTSTSEERTKRPSADRRITYGQEAVIETRMPFAAAFETAFTIFAEPSQGSMEVVLLGGEPARPRYRLVYHASPSGERPIEIVRDNGGRKYVIQAAATCPVLEDGIEHYVQWIRDIHGNMSVLVDGQSVLHTVELYYSDSFAGLALVNRGGAYEWDSIRILQPEKKGRGQ